jgi:hypothetical protein
VLISLFNIEGSAVVILLLLCSVCWWYSCSRGYPSLSLSHFAAQNACKVQGNIAYLNYWKGSVNILFLTTVATEVEMIL